MVSKPSTGEDALHRRERRQGRGKKGGRSIGCGGVGLVKRDAKLIAPARNMS